MKKSLISLFLALIVLAGCGKFLSPEDDWICTDQGWVKHGNPSAPMPNWVCGEKGEAERAVEPALDNEQKPEAGGGSVEARQETEGDFESPPGVIEGNIVVDSPKPNEKVVFPIKVYGKARVFENMFNWSLKDANGKEIAHGPATTNGSEMGKYGAYQFVIEKTEAQSGSATLEVFDYSAKDGSSQDLVSIPLLLESTRETSTLKLFFVNNKLDPKVTCEKVFPVERTIPKTPKVAEAALQLLLMGPTADERYLQYTTQLNDGVHLNKLTIVEGVARADFDNKLEEGVGGSCRVGLIRRQIEETLKQFPTVKEVAISIEGKSDDEILQP